MRGEEYKTSREGDTSSHMRKTGGGLCVCISVCVLALHHKIFLLLAIAKRELDA